MNRALCGCYVVTNDELRGIVCRQDQRRLRLGGRAPACPGDNHSPLLQLSNNYGKQTDSLLQLPVFLDWYLTILIVLI